MASRSAAGGGGTGAVPSIAGASVGEANTLAPDERLRAAADPTWSRWQWVSRIAVMSSTDRPMAARAATITRSPAGMLVSMSVTPSSPSTRKALTYSGGRRVRVVTW
jgi:hypothetical protein